MILFQYKATQNHQVHNFQRRPTEANLLMWEDIWNTQPHQPKLEVVHQTNQHLGHATDLRQRMQMLAII